MPGAKGEIVALNLENGQVKWRKEAPGGILSTVAVSGGLAVATATDGVVRAWSVADGAEKWSYHGGDPFFAGPAIAAGVVYAADLKGNVHAIALADGKPQWVFNWPTTPPSRRRAWFGSPVVHGGDLYLGTNNLEGENTDKPSVVICLSDNPPGGANRSAATIAIDKQSRSITFDAKVAPRKNCRIQRRSIRSKLVATSPTPRGQKAHETVVTFEAKPSEIHRALDQLGAQPGHPAKGEDGAASGPRCASRSRSRAPPASRGSSRSSRS